MAAREMLATIDVAQVATKAIFAARDLMGSLFTDVLPGSYVTSHEVFLFKLCNAPRNLLSNRCFYRVLKLSRFRGHGVQLLCIGIVGEYVAKIYSETKALPYRKGRAPTIAHAQQSSPERNVTQWRRLDSDVTGIWSRLMFPRMERGDLEMPKQRSTTGEIIQKLREAVVLIGQGRTIDEACKRIGIADNTYFRWRTTHGGLRTRSF